MNVTLSLILRPGLQYDLEELSWFAAWEKLRGAHRVGKELL